MTDDNFDLTQFLPYRLAALSERVSKALSKIYSDPHGLSVADWRVLVHTATQNAVSVREIHQTVNLEKPRVSRAVARLVERGLLRKETETADKRLVHITLTPDGRSVLDEILPKALEFERRLTEMIDKDTLSAFNAVSAQLHEYLEAIESDDRSTRKN